MRDSHGDGSDPPVLNAASGRDVKDFAHHVAGGPDGGGGSRRLVVGADHFNARRDDVVAPAILAGLAICGGQTRPHSPVSRSVHARGRLIEGLKTGCEYGCHGATMAVAEALRIP